MSNPEPTDTPRQLKVGDQLGQYKLVELLARGGMGLVYRAYDSGLKRFVAVKVLAPELVRDTEVAQRFLDEARAAAALNHPNIVHVYAAGEHDGVVYFAMELVTGEQLETLLTRRHKMPIREAVEFTQQVGRGLQHAHEHGLIHGDVKPANFLVASTGTVKIADFGLVRRVKSGAGKPGNESLFGTPVYISPEALAGQATDHRSDIYSLGATLFQMLADRPPYVSATTDETLQMHTSAPVPNVQTFNPDVPNSLAQIVSRMLAKDPGERYQSYAELLQTLDRCLDEIRLTNVPAQRKSARGKVFILLAILAVTGAAIWFALRDQPNGKSVIDREAPATTAFQALKAEADKFSNQLSQADEVYARGWTNQFADTKVNQLVDAERAKLCELASQQWQGAQIEIKKLHADDKLAEAIEICTQQATNCTSFAKLPAAIAVVRQKLEEERQAQIAAAEKVAAAAAVEAALKRAAAEKAAAIVAAEAEKKRQAEAVEARKAAEIVQARQARLEQLKVELQNLITGLQWEKGRQLVQATSVEADKDSVFRQELDRWQSEFDCLFALRNGLNARLKVAPVTLKTKSGELTGQVVSFDAIQILLRQKAGDYGFAETVIPWSALPPASACQFFLTGIDRGQPDEVVGYAAFLAHQVLAKSKLGMDACKILKAAIERVPVRAAVLEVYRAAICEK